MLIWNTSEELTGTLIVAALSVGLALVKWGWRKRRHR